MTRTGFTIDSLILHRISQNFTMPKGKSSFLGSGYDCRQHSRRFGSICKEDAGNATRRDDFPLEQKDTQI